MFLDKKTNLKPGHSTVRRLPAAAGIALALFLALAGGRPALASIAAGEAAFNKGDYFAAVSEFQRPAYGGDAVARYYMGVIYADGLGVSRSLEDGLVWFRCALIGTLPSSMERDIRRRLGGVVSGISRYGLEQAGMRIESLCGKAMKELRGSKDISDNRDAPDNIRPKRSLLTRMLFFPGDTMVTGAAVVFHGLGLSFISKFLGGLVKVMGDWLFGLLALIGWLLVGRILQMIGEPIWKKLFARDPVSGDAQPGGGSGPQTEASETD